MILDRRVALLVLQGAAALCRERPQGHALIYLHMLADLCRLADDDSRRMVDEEAPADRRARMDVDARAAVCVLRHDARDHGHAEHMKLMREAMHADRVKTRIGVDDLGLARRCGIALERRMNVQFDVGANLRYGTKEGERDLLRTISNDLFRLHRRTFARQGDGNLLIQQISHIFHDHRHIILDAVDTVVLVLEVAGKDDAHELVEDVDDRLLVGTTEHVHLVDDAIRLVVGEDVADDAVQIFRYDVRHFFTSLSFRKCGALPLFLSSLRTKSSFTCRARRAGST